MLGDWKNKETINDHFMQPLFAIQSKSIMFRAVNPRSEINQIHRGAYSDYKVQKNLIKRFIVVQGSGDPLALYAEGVQHAGPSRGGGRYGTSVGGGRVGGGGGGEGAGGGSGAAGGGTGKGRKGSVNSKGSQQQQQQA